jgi:hypothetical protein
MTGTLDDAGDVVNRRTLKPLLRDSILRGAVQAFYGPVTKQAVQPLPDPA